MCVYGLSICVLMSLPLSDVLVLFLHRHWIWAYCVKKKYASMSLSLYVAMTLMLPLTVLNLSFCFSVTFLYLLCVKHFKCMNVNTNKQIKHALLHIVTHKSKRSSNATKSRKFCSKKVTYSRLCLPFNC